MLGGYLYICETEADIDLIETVEWDDGKGRYLNPHEAVVVWDHICYCGPWANLFLATNNAGGPQYLVPPHLFEYARIEEQMAKAANEEPL